MHRNLMVAARYTSSGSFIVHVGVITIYTSGCAGSTLATNSSSNLTGGSGGGACQRVIRLPINVTPGQVIPVTIGAGAFTYDMLLDRTAAIPGDIVKIKINGSSSANPTIRILDGSTAVVLSSFNTITGTKWIAGEYVFKESGVWVESFLIDSVEGTY